MKILQLHLNEIYIDDWRNQNAMNLPLPNAFQYMDMSEFEIRCPSPDIQRFFTAVIRKDTLSKNINSPAMFKMEYLQAILGLILDQ